MPKTSIDKYYSTIFWKIQIQLGKKTIWVKYAGSWEKPTSNSYRLQKWLIRNSKIKLVSINDVVLSEASNFLTIYNPCVVEDEIQPAKLWADKRNFSINLLKFCFVCLLCNGIDNENGSIFITECTNPNLYR